MQITYRLFTFISVLTVLFLAGCSGDGPSLVSVIDSSGSLSIDITKEQVPEFSWDEDAIAQAISVRRYNTQGSLDQTVWGYANTSVLSPVTYGQVLQGVNLTGTSTASPLQTGVRYRVTIVSDGSESSAEWLAP